MDLRHCIISSQICKAIDEHYKNNSLDEAGAHNIIERFGYERPMVILANTVHQKDWDGRFSPDNRKWAETVPAPCDMLGERGRRFMIDKVHPGLVNLFIDQVRREYERTYGRQSIRAALIDNTAQAAAEPKPHKKSEQSL